MTEPAIDQEVIDFAHQIFEMARNGNTDELVAYINAGVPVNLTNDKGDTLIMLAAYHVHPQTVSVLLELGADHARINDRGQTALGAAVFRKCDEAVTALLKAGADPKLGKPSAMEIAQFFDLPDQLKVLQ